MTRAIAALGILVLISACGADGAPTPPPAKPSATGLTISGNGRFGATADL